MKSVRSLAPVFTLVSALGISVWAAGCAEEVPPVAPNGIEVEDTESAGSATGGGYTVPPAPSETDGAPATEAPAEETTQPPAGAASDAPAADAPASESSDAPPAQPE